ncbi:MAG: glycosyltransferase family 2 protein [Rhodospirillales bacterium]
MNDIATGIAAGGLRPDDGGTVELTILMPCLNEARTVGVCVEKAVGYLRRAGIAGEVLVADNGSTDGSQDIARANGARVIAVPRRGYGAALAAGIAEARGRFVIMGDSDDSYDFTALDGFVAALRAGAELAMGNRFKGGIKPSAMPPLHRYFGNPALTMIGRVLFRSPLGDFYCGLRGFDRDAIRRLRLDTPGMEFALEMVVKATIHGLRVAEVPTTLSPDGRTRPPHLRSWRDGWRSLRFFLTLSPRSIFLYPGIVLALVGGVLAAALMVGDIRLGTVLLGYHTLLFACAALLLGVQMIGFWVFAKIVAMQRGLLRADQQLERALARVPMELGLATGIVVFAAGFAAAAYALGNWAGTGFGPLTGASTLRWTIGAATAMVLGAHLVFASFFRYLLENRRD